MTARFPGGNPEHKPKKAEPNPPPVVVKQPRRSPLVPMLLCAAILRPRPVVYRPVYRRPPMMVVHPRPAFRPGPVAVVGHRGVAVVHPRPMNRAIVTPNRAVVVHPKPAMRQPVAVAVKPNRGGGMTVGVARGGGRRMGGGMGGRRR